MDGRIDFSGYSLAELREAASSINAKKYPKNYANLTDAIEKKLAESPAQSFEELAEPPLRGWGKPDSPKDEQPLRSKDLVWYVTIFVVAVIAQSYLIPAALAEYGVPAGRWVRIIYYSNAGMLVAHRFARKHSRLFYPREVIEVMGASLATIVLLEIAIGLFLLPYLVEATLVTGRVIFSMTLSYVFLVFIDAILLFLAFQFPVRWFMIWTTKRLGAISS